jgi:hypothetical protein
MYFKRFLIVNKSSTTNFVSILFSNQWVYPTVDVAYFSLQITNTKRHVNK